MTTAIWIEEEKKKWGVKEWKGWTTSSFGALRRDAAWEAALRLTRKHDATVNMDKVNDAIC